jgi:hypothetical protein
MVRSWLALVWRILDCHRHVGVAEAGTVVHMRGYGQSTEAGEPEAFLSATTETKVPMASIAKEKGDWVRLGGMEPSDSGACD